MSGLISFKLATGWVEKLAKKYAKSREERIAELEPIADELMVIPQELAPVFVEPDLQPYNPADDSGQEDKEFRVPALKFIEKFIDDRKELIDGRRHLFILADAGMGKSSILAMFTLAHVNGFWPKGYDCIPHKLGPDTLDFLKTIKGRGNKVLLFDALDEDSEAIGRIKERISELLKETKNFLRVIITCRNQYLPLGDIEIFPRQDRIKISGMTCPVKYISPFSDSQVENFLQKRYPSGWFRKNKKIEKAKNISNQTGDLRFRPMLLARIDDLLDEEYADNPYQIYKALVDKWLDREVTKSDPSYKREKLLLACILLARSLMHKKKREIEERELNEIIFSDPELKVVKAVNFGGRSLLNRTSTGGFRFAHQSFQEFLVVHALEHRLKGDWPNPTEMIKLFLFRGFFKLDIFQATSFSVSSRVYSSKKPGLKFETRWLGGVNLKGQNLSLFDLEGAYLREANLRCANLSGANLNRANLSSVDLSGADLSDADLGGANLSGANLSRVDLSRTDLRGANLIGANLESIREWKTAAWVNANINLVLSAPVLFRNWALKRGAFELDIEEF